MLEDVFSRHGYAPVHLRVPRGDRCVPPLVPKRAQQARGREDRSGRPLRHGPIRGRRSPRLESLMSSSGSLIGLAAPNLSHPARPSVPFCRTVAVGVSSMC